MFDKPGEKIQSLAKVLFWLSAIGFVIWAMVTAIKFKEIGYGDFPVARFLILLIGGPLASYISSLVLYGFGELIIVSDRIYRTADKKLEPKIMYVDKTAGEGTANKPWRCPQCNRANDGSVRICECGQAKPEKAI